MRIRELASSGTPLRRIAREFGVSQRAVQSIVRMHVWKHIAITPVNDESSKEDAA